MRCVPFWYKVLTSKAHEGRLLRKVASQAVEMHEKPKMSMMKRITECEVRSSCAFLKSKAERRMMVKLRGGTAAFQMR